ncbi:ABC transporter ATP-binding protein, partial [Rhizobium hidalgonense]|nr:ABC transporter ATP-binding protein [Rhizobium hidalgonense]
IKKYSNGMRARLAFAISMAVEFDCFLIDEVVSVGDQRFHEKCHHELFQKRADRAMILVSHDVQFIRQHCTRASVLHRGQLTNFDNLDSAFEFYDASIHQI